MRIPLFKRLVITFFNIFFPPLAVGLLTGFTSSDTMLNACLFLLAVIPSHIHGFYISLTYFGRKRKVRRGKWPGKPHKPGIWSERVLTGGAGWEEAERLKKANGRKSTAYVNGMPGDSPISRRSSGRSGRDSSRRRRSQVRSGVGNENGNLSRVQTPMRDSSTYAVPGAGQAISRSSRQYG